MMATLIGRLLPQKYALWLVLVHYVVGSHLDGMDRLSMVNNAVHVVSPGEEERKIRY